MNKEDKIKKYLLIGIAAFVFLIFIKVGGINKKLKRDVIPTLSRVELISDSTLTKTLSINEMILLLEINGYEVSHRVVYDNNAVVRTKQRPDDIMKSYTDKIKVLNKELEDVSNR